jgi:NADH:ubiquinone oxidoreductase subunit 2 (subunit N)
MILTNILGISLLIYSYDWLLLLVSWELFNISLYLLVSINYKLSESSLSSTLKYFLLSALSTSLFLLGILFFYISSGSTNFDSISLLTFYSLNSLELQLASIFIFSSILLKLAAAPLHNYAIDLYTVIPLYITMYMVTIPKMGVLILLYLLSSLNI